MPGIVHVIQEQCDIVRARGITLADILGQRLATEELEHVLGEKYMGLSGLNAVDAIDFVRELVSLYFGKRELTALQDYMEARTSWIGTGKDEFSRNLEEAQGALAGELAEYGGGFAVTGTCLEYAPLSERCGVVYGTLMAEPYDQALSNEDLRLTVVLEQTQFGPKLVHMHFSHADLEQEPGSYFVRQAVRADNQSLRHALDVRDRQLANLTKNIPGGAHQCANDPNLTLISVSDGFLSMFGYTKEEIERLFDGTFVNMIYPGDRASMLKSTYGQLENGSDIEVEYRVLRKNGQPVWVLDKRRLIDDGSGNSCFYSVLIDITLRKSQEEELRLSLERHQVIINQATDIIFEWDIRRDTLSFSANWKKKFGYDPIERNISGRIPLSDNIHIDDIPAFVKIMKDTAAGVPYSETEFRIRDITGRYFWCRIRATAQYSSDGLPIKAVGVIVDIDAEKKQREVLLEKIQHDTLTGIYNKAAIDTLVEQRMQGGNLPGRQALLIIDVDYFKAVNDTYGHLCGDSVLSDVAAALKGSTRASDLVGRIGGDEFLVYLPEVTDETDVRQMVERILDAVSCIRPEPGAPTITCSVGVAMFPWGGIDYYNLYKCADQALYAQKHNGRGGCSFYMSSPDATVDDSAPTAVGTAIVSDEGNVADEWLAQYAFRTLYETRDIALAIDRLLEIIGRSCDVSRVYIFESSADGERCSNTFEWCSEGVTPQIELLQNIAYVDELGDYLRNFDANGIFYCHDIETLHPNVFAVLEPQGIRSILQCAMLDEGKFAGYVGFDECRENRAWSQRQMDAFKLTADVLSTFLMKLRQKQKEQLP